MPSVCTDGGDRTPPDQRLTCGAIRGFSGCTTASVITPTATGTVQFREGTANFGGPARVVGGRAIGPVITFLAKGSHSLTAVFIPTNPAEFTPSTSNTVTVIF